LYFILKMKEYKLHNLEDLQNTVKSIIPQIKHKIILLKGNLGAGKTTFTKEFCKQIQCSDEISSPTYSLINEYRYPDGKIYHFDLYRMKSLEECFDIGIEEYLESGNLCLIEWPELFQEEIIVKYHEICIFNHSNYRQLTFE